MKRIAKMMCLLALVALVGTSCKKQEERISFKATLGELEFESEDKLYLVGKKFWFQAGDQVRMFNVQKEVFGQSSMGLFEANAEGLTTDFVPVGSETDMDVNRKDVFFAYFPGESQMVSPFMDNSGEIYGQYGQGHQVPNYVKFTLENTQTYRTVGAEDAIAIPERALYAAAKNESAANINGADFTFDLIGGVLTLKFYNNTSVDSLFVDQITVRDKDRFLTGDVWMRIDRVDPAHLARLFKLYNPESQSYMRELANYIEYVGYRVPGLDEGNTNLSNTITLNCPSVKLGKTKETATQFVLGVRPLGLAKGMVIDVYMNDGNGSTYHYQKDTNVDCTIAPAMIRNISPLKMTNTNTALVP